MIVEVTASEELWKRTIEKLTELLGHKSPQKALKAPST